MRITILLPFTVFLISCRMQETENYIHQSNFYQFDKPRVAAEWEPAKGVMFSCPPIIPKELIIELASDTHIYPIVDGKEEEDEARRWFKMWGIDSTKVSFINLKVDRDIPWLRDWGPSAVFMKNGDFKLADAKFINSDPFTDRICNDSLDLQKVDSTGLDYYSTYAENAILPLAKQLGMEVENIPFTNTGGNVLTDGIGTAFSTCMLLTENRYNGLSDEEFFHLNDSLLGYENYHVISNFEKYGIQHIDCLLKLVDEETLLVAQPPIDHELYSIYEDIVNNELTKLRSSYGRPYNIKRIKLTRIIDDYLTAYTNSLILNQTVYVPLYNVSADSAALKTWESVMPGHTVKGFYFVMDDQPYKSKHPFYLYPDGVTSGWAPDDALHCRTRAIWDPEMIFISIKKILPTVQINEEAVVYATIRDYSDAEIEESGVNIYWRVKGSNDWNKKNMLKYNSMNHWFAKIPDQKNNLEIDYYIEVQSKAGNIGRRPITAPKGHYSFKFIAQQEAINYGEFEGN